MKYDIIKGRFLNYFLIVAGLAGLIASCQQEGCQSYGQTKSYENKLSLDSLSNTKYNQLEKTIIEQK